MLGKGEESIYGHKKEGSLAGMPTVYVALLNEGTVAWRPVPARHLGDSRYELLGIVPSQEEWQFSSGQTVECEMQVLSDSEALIAVRLVKED